MSDASYLRLQFRRIIKDALVEKGMTQNEQAARLGVTYSTVSQVLSGRQGLTLAKLVEYADALGITLNLVRADDELRLPPT